MPLSKDKNCRHCASTTHKSHLCPRVDRSPPPPPPPPPPADPKAAARAAARAAASRAKAAAKAAAKDAAKVKAAMKRASQRAVLIAQRARVAQVQAVHTAVHAAFELAGVAFHTTPANYRNSNWAMVSDVCSACGHPPGGCMCI